ncbi:MAG: type II secretion system inner membrane protein GspF [Planctomycetes bacterium]|nr:type II secretion system inner membrane protein GspF [Planctomycetota bacterium]
MPVFTFEAVDKKGQKVADKVEASSKQDALAQIKRRGLRPTSVQQLAGAKGAPTEKKKKFKLFNRVGRAQMTQLTTQLATLQDAGLPIVRSLRILETQQKPGRLKDILGEIAGDVEAGSSLSESLAKHPKVFDVLYVSMVRAGEAGGVLDTILQRLADFQEKSLKLRKRVQGAMYYPIAVVVVATVILAFIMTKVVPNFEKMFQDMGQDLPLMTQFLLDVSRTVQSRWYLLVGVPILLVVGYRLILRTEKGRRGIDRLKLKMPIFGPIVNKSTISRFCRTLGTLIASGVPILDALRIVRDAIGNRIIADAVDQVHGSIREGETIAEPLRASGAFDDMLVNMIDVGEETGELDKMLLKIADNYDLDVDVAVESLSSLLEPILIISMGVVVGFIVIALFMPLIQIIQKL